MDRKLNIHCQCNACKAITGRMGGSDYAPRILDIFSRTYGRNAWETSPVVGICPGPEGSCESCQIETSFAWPSEIPVRVLEPMAPAYESCSVPEDPVKERLIYSVLGVSKKLERWQMARKYDPIGTPDTSKLVPELSRLHLGSNNDKDGEFPRPEPNEGVPQYAGSEADCESEDGDGEFPCPEPDEGVLLYAGGETDRESEDGDGELPCPESSSGASLQFSEDRGSWSWRSLEAAQQFWMM